MLGTINGAFVNRVVLNGRGGESLIVADASLVQADATAVSAGAVLAAAAHSHSVADHVLTGSGAVSVAAAHSHSVADHVLTGSGAVSVAAALEALQSGVLLSDGSVPVASMAELTHDDHTLRVTFKPFLVRRIGGSRLTLH